MSIIGAYAPHAHSVSTESKKHAHALYVNTSFSLFPSLPSLPSLYLSLSLSLNHDDKDSMVWLFGSEPPLHIPCLAIKPRNQDMKHILCHADQNPKLLFLMLVRQANFGVLANSITTTLQKWIIVTPKSRTIMRAVPLVLQSNKKRFGAAPGTCLNSIL